MSSRSAISYTYTSPTVEMYAKVLKRACLYHCVGVFYQSEFEVSMLVLHLAPLLMS
jgi:hypothetical protein